ncbi:MAG: hydroxymethylbilane synthase [Acidithiobacillus sp.]
MQAPLRIGTRASPLALWQAEHVRNGILRHHPESTVEIVPLTTSGDQFLDVPLHVVGGKGLFVKEIEDALLDGRVDLAVHSMKDVPARQPAGLEIAAILVREDVRDAFVSTRYPDPAALPDGARVGSSSLRRRAQLLARFPHLQVDDLRGNVATRLGKLDAGRYDAVILAAAGLKRLGLAERISAFLAAEDSLPAVGQGAIGVEIRQDDAAARAIIATLNDRETSLCVHAERAMNQTLGGDCRLPVAALAQCGSDGSLYLRGLVATADGSRILRAGAAGRNAFDLGQAVAAQLLAQGAAAIIAEITHT